MTADLTRLIAPRPAAAQSTWQWATVLTVSPLSIQLDTSTDPLPDPPTSLVPLAAGDIGKRVWVQQIGRYAVIIGVKA